MRKMLLLPFIVASIASCSPADKKNFSEHDESSYGVWVANRNYVLVITRDEKWQFCDRKECVQGPLVPPRYFLVKPIVILGGFLRHDVVNRLNIDAVNAPPHIPDMPKSMPAVTPYRTDVLYDVMFYGGDCGGYICAGFGGDKDEGIAFRKVMNY